MPSISGQTLTLTTVNNDVTVDVTYNATFSPIDRFLGSNGLVFQERITVVGEDAGTATDVNLHTFPFQNIAVSAGGAPLVVPRTRSITKPRGTFQEDSAAGDNDEIDCRIEIVPIGLPATVSGTTPQQVLLG
jgi:hypothetical protein